MHELSPEEIQLLNENPFWKQPSWRRACRLQASDFPTLKLSVVGGRPFLVVVTSCSGKGFFLQGLGSNLNDICGKDWVFGGGDHDLAQAIAHLKETTKLNIPLVVFGHMHKELAYGNGLRKMIVVSTDNTIYLNGAIVPRVKRINDDQRAPNRSFMNSETSQLTPESKGTRRAFTLVEILEGEWIKLQKHGFLLLEM
ncbi:hypothetical protein GH714_011496 [Hevea brasiliensis]|uniref:Calcineurin-like phosphoesterase domain-containing protein n=1 Tax=Hevea brasiliensis TaxID=3981 RepID=A0A6A6MZ17_HEVBR|nr:hypothetical protein GH714_011496 [Hevea brasiliensis]